MCRIAELEFFITLLIRQWVHNRCRIAELVFSITVLKTVFVHNL